jgi:long-subunit fatty acid transport protein
VRSVVVVVVCCCVAFSARAQDFVGARPLALGEAYRAIATGNDAIYFNPAGLPTLKRYALEGHYLMNLADENHQADISLVDSKTNPLAVGLAYTFQGKELTKRSTFEHTATLAVAYPIFEKLWSVGAGFKYKNVSDAIAGNYLNALSADLGMLSEIPGGLSFAAVGYNIIPIRSAESAHVPISAAFAGAWDLGPLSALLFGGTPGFGVIQTAAGVPKTPTFGDMRGPLDGLTLSFDWLINFETLYGAKSRISGGIEYLVADLVPLRAGYVYDQVTAEQDGADPNRVSVGAGFIVPYFGLDVSYQLGVPDFDKGIFALSLKGFLPM